MGRTEGTPHRAQSWPETTTLSEVMVYATGQFSNKLILLAAAEREQDTYAMHLACRELRKVVTRIDQFRRLRVRQWRVQPASSQKITSHPPDSAT